MFCSEFVAMATKDCLDLLQNEINKDITLFKEKNTKNAIEHHKNIFHTLFEKDENFEAMHPGYLASCMMKFCHIQEPLETISKMVDLKTTARFF